MTVSHSAVVGRAALAAVALAVAALVWQFDSLTIRVSALGNSHDCYLKLARDMPSRVDVLLIGSSRVRRGIVPELLGELLGSAKQPLTVVNWGRPFRDPDLDLALFDTLTRDSTVTLAAIEVNVGERRPIERLTNKTRSASAAPILARFDFLFTRFVTVEGMGLVERLYELVSALRLKIEGASRILLTGRVGEKGDRTGAEAFDDSRPGICWLTQWNSPSADSSKPPQKRRAAFEARHGTWFADGYEEVSFLSDAVWARTVLTLKEIVHLANARGIDVVFFYQPEYFVWPPSPQFSVAFEKAIGAPLFVPDKSILNRLQDGGFKDASHLTARGREITTRWLADSLRNRINSN